MCSLLLGGGEGGSSPSLPSGGGRVIYTVAALEKPYPGRYLPMEGMKPTLQKQMLAGALVTPAGLFSGISWFSGRVVSFPFTPSISWADPALASTAGVLFDLSAFVVVAGHPIHPTSSAPGHVAIKDSAPTSSSRRPGKVSDLDLECLASLFSRNLEETWSLSDIYCCGDDLAMAKDMPFLFLSLPFAVISARSASCERRSPRTSTAGGLGRDVPKSIP